MTNSSRSLRELAQEAIRDAQHYGSVMGEPDSLSGFDRATNGRDKKEFSTATLLLAISAQEATLAQLQRDAALGRALNNLLDNNGGVSLTRPWGKSYQIRFGCPGRTIEVDELTEGLRQVREYYGSLWGDAGKNGPQ